MIEKVFGKVVPEDERVSGDFLDEAIVTALSRYVDDGRFFRAESRDAFVEGALALADRLPASEFADPDDLADRLRAAGTDVSFIDDVGISRADARSAGTPEEFEDLVSDRPVVFSSGSSIRFVYVAPRAVAAWELQSDDVSSGVSGQLADEVARSVCGRYAAKGMFTSATSMSGIGHGTEALLRKVPGGKACAADVADHIVVATSRYNLARACGMGEDGDEDGFLRGMPFVEVNEGRVACMAYKD